MSPKAQCSVVQCSAIKIRMCLPGHQVNIIISKTRALIMTILSKIYCVL